MPRKHLGMLKRLHRVAGLRRHCCGVPGVAAARPPTAPRCPEKEPSESPTKKPKKEGLSERRLKQYSVSAKPGKLPLTVGITGARAGDVLRGVEDASSGDVANVVLRLVSGTVSAPSIIRRSVEAEVGREALIAAVAKHFGESRAAATLRYNDFPQTEVPNHQPLGSGCSHGVEENCSCPPAATFVIVSQGVWQSFADQHGNGEELQAMVEERRTVCWRDVLKLMYTPGLPEGKKLILRPRLFEIVAGPEQLPATHPEVKKADVLDAVSWSSGGCQGPEHVHYKLDGYVVRVPASSQVAFQMQVEAVQEAVDGLVPSCSADSVRHCIAQLRPLSMGALKSCLQKVIRFHAVAVDYGECIPSPLLAATATGLLFANRGGFSPELQLFTRGATAAFKRLAVILLEDAWVKEDKTPSCVAALLSLGLVTQRVADYEPPRSSVVAAMRMAARAASSSCIIAWRQKENRVSKASAQVRKADEYINVSKEQATLFQHSAKLLHLLRSFSGDMAMFDQVAAASKAGKLPLQHAAKRPEVMPLCHLVDQHTYRGIAHVLGEGAESTFALRFESLFSKCTGFNPRLADPEGFESRIEVQRARFAQQCCLNAAQQKPKTLLPLISDGAWVCLELDPGVLSAAVGPVPTKVRGKRGSRDLLVLLGVRCPEDEVVMQKPARATRDLFGDLTDQERAEAVAAVRSQQLRVQSLLLPGLHEAKFVDGSWQVDGTKWADLVSKGIRIKVPQVAAPSWCDTLNTKNAEALLRNDAALEEALGVSGAGMIPRAEEVVLTLVSSLPHAVSLRAVSLLRQQYVSVSMPTPSLQGGLADQLAAYDGDWLVYRLLVLISRTVPTALRPTMPPNFTVTNPVILRVVEGWIMAGVERAMLSQNAAASIPKSSAQWEGHTSWTAMSRADESLLEHQREAVDRMHQRDREMKCGGHFLIMDTGLGKTVTSLVYAYRWLCSTGGKAVRRILWVTPAGTVENLVKQLCQTWHCPTHVVPRISSAKKPKAGEGFELVLKDFMVNVIHADHLRTAIDKGLAEQATSSFIIFDEVDEMYAPTLRTSAARRLCQLCPKFVAQTATPMRKNESQLLAWLADTCSFPVDTKNWLVAASGMVSMQLELGIAAIEEEILVPMVDEVRALCRKLLSSSSTVRWLEMARVVQEHTDKAMAEAAVKAAKQDRKSHADGGVLLVADSLQHAAKLRDLCSPHLPTGDFASLEAPDAKRFAIVVVTKDKDRGYNSARRLGVMVTGAYAGNAASRHQLRGRLRRLGQKRKEVRFVTVCMENSILHLLHQRHSAVDTMNISLEQLGQRFSAEVMKGLGS